MSPAAPQNPSKLVGTKWTAVEVEEDRLHWDVVEYRPSTGDVVLRAVMDGETLCFPWRELRDRSSWKPGW